MTLLLQVIVDQLKGDIHETIGFVVSIVNVIPVVLPARSDTIKLCVASPVIHVPDI